jgi:hypothetical protein
LVLCHDFYHSVNPQGILKHDSSSEQATLNQADRMVQHKKVKQWFLNPTKFRREIEAKQRKHPGKCIYHLTKSHPTTDCNVKKECDKLLAGNKDSSTTSVSSGQLRNVKEDMFEDAVSDDIEDVLPETPSNDTNKDDLYYFARLSNHYLHLVKASPPVAVPFRHQMQFPIIADSGANLHCSKNVHFMRHYFLLVVKLFLEMEKLLCPSKVLER